MKANNYTPPVDESELDRGLASSFASLGPIYWLGDEPTGSYQDENGNTIHYAVDMADGTISPRLRLVTILSICVIIASIMLIGVMIYYWRLWNKQQQQLNRQISVEPVMKLPEDLS